MRAGTIPVEVALPPVCLQETLEVRRRQQRRDKLRLLGHTNALRCAACPTYGRDLVEAVTVVQDPRPVARCPWGGTGYVACLNAPALGETQLWRYTRALRSLVRTPPQLLAELRDMVDRWAPFFTSFSSRDNLGRSLIGLDGRKGSPK